MTDDLMVGPLPSYVYDAIDIFVDAGLLESATTFPDEMRRRLAPANPPPALEPTLF